MQKGLQVSNLLQEQCLNGEIVLVLLEMMGYLFVYAFVFWGYS